METEHRLLVLSCSQCKRSDAGLLPALDRYDGPAFRVLRRFLRCSALPGTESTCLEGLRPTVLRTGHILGRDSVDTASYNPPDIYILSAEFGLISHDRLIPYYDRCMTTRRAQQLRPCVIAELEHILSIQSYAALCFCTGQAYIQALEGYKALVSPQTSLMLAAGGTGRCLSLLYRWLYGASPISQPSAAPQGKAHIRGIELIGAPNEILDLARQRIAEGCKEATHYQAWYVCIDDQRVSPKWLVSVLSGLPVGAFHTDDARRVLHQLGIEVRSEIGGHSEQ